MHRTRRLVLDIKVDLTMPIFLENVTVTYDRHPAVHHLSAVIAEGSLVALVGPNGAGKSTLLNALMGLEKVSEGKILGIEREGVAYLPQQALINKEIPISVQELVFSGLWKAVGISRSMAPEHKEYCAQAIDSVGLSGFEKRQISTLSGGQLQRALFARVLVQDCSTILLDEPFNAVDTETTRDLTEVILTWHAQKRTVVLVSHELPYVRDICPTSLLLARECIAYGATHCVLSNENLKKARRMVEAVDRQAPICKRVKAA